MYINTTTFTLHSEADIRRLNPNTSFGYPFVPPAAFKVVFPAPQPAHNAVTRTVREITPSVSPLGAWEQRWEIVELFATQGERDAAIAAAAAAASARVVEAFDLALTEHLDATARAKKYDNRITCMVRAGFIGPFQAEGLAFATWCDTCNILAYQMLAAVQAGTEPMPASPAAFIATLPLMVWPT